ncbi:MAG: hypothetical protein K2K57_13515 [Oscillospiraceae bacterium]|nr:hypothetical protein [Oscillospiraceae bacterium]
MKYIDYREQLGLGINDIKKFEMLRNKIDALLNFLLNVLQTSDYRTPSFIDYFLIVSESPDKQCLYSVYYSLHNSISLNELIYKFTVFSNTIHKHITHKDCIKLIRNFLSTELENLNIQYEIVNDSDGSFIFPKGAKELDEALVSAPLQWLSDYPNAHKQWISALKHYSELNQDNVSETVDMFRKALEAFFQEFFGGSKSLENYKGDYGNYLKSHNIPKEISGNFETILQAYTYYINNYAKHHDKANINATEYIMYQSGNIIRLLITLKQSDTNNPD